MKMDFALHAFLFSTRTKQEDANRRDETIGDIRKEEGNAENRKETKKHYLVRM